MNILFLTVAQHLLDLSSRGVYQDLMRKFRDEGHNIYIASPTERRNKEKTHLLKTDGVTILRIKTLNITQINQIEKGIATLLIDNQYYKAIKKHFSRVHFELLLYSTPPVTFVKVINFIKCRDKALCYLLLKDIFPQNAVDLGMIKKDGLLHKYFRKKEKELYAVSDFIGCMSPANVDFIIKNNPDIKPEIVEVNPNSIEPINSLIDKKQISEIRNRYKIPANSTAFIYGGSFGKPQCIEFLIDTINSFINNKKVFFVLVGSGTEFQRLNDLVSNMQPKNLLLLSRLPKNEFDMLLQSCDVGMIFLDKRFTIPNFPSRLLSYLECKLPVIAATDKTTDLGPIIVENNFGLWSEAGYIQSINENIERLAQDISLRGVLGENGFNYMMKNYRVLNSYLTIIRHFSK